MTPPLRSATPPLPPIIWWAIWLGIVSGVILVFVFLGGKRSGTGPAPSAIVDYLGVAPVLGSAVLRWLVFPRVTRRAAAFIFFIVGLALAESCGFLGIFLGSRPKELFVLSLLGLAQWVPVFASSLAKGGSEGLRSDSAGER